MKNKKSPLGFTIIELLIIILVAGILAAIALPRYMKHIEKSRTTQLLFIIRAIENAEERFYLENGAYTNNISNLDIDMPAIDNKQYKFAWSNMIFLAATKKVQIQVSFSSNTHSTDCWAINDSLSEYVCASLGKKTNLCSYCSLLEGKECCRYKIK